MTTTMASYTTQLQAGLGMVEETMTLLNLWHEGIDVSEICRLALSSGQFPNVSARRLRNIVAECFAPRLLADKARPAKTMKLLSPHLDPRSIRQLLFLYTCRANQILSHFVRDVYWEAYLAGRTEIENETAREFVVRANQDGMTTKQWSETTVRRVGSYLTGCCCDFGLLESGPRTKRRILPFRIEPQVTTVLAYDLHFAGLGDNQVLASEDWRLFGLEREDVLNELKRQSLQGKFIVQTAGGISKISWPCKSIEELVDVIADG